MNHFLGTPRDITHLVLSYLNLQDLNIFRKSEMLPIEEFDSQIFWIVYFRSHNTILVSKRENYFDWVLEYKLSLDCIYASRLRYDDSLRNDATFNKEISVIHAGFNQHTLMILNKYLDDYSKTLIMDHPGDVYYLNIERNPSKLVLQFGVYEFRFKKIILTENRDDIIGLLFQIYYHTHK